MMLDQDLRTRRSNRTRRAVIVDVDETVVDNSSYHAMLLKIKVNKLTFSEPWHTLAARSATLNSVNFANHMTSMMDASAEDDDADKMLENVIRSG